MVVITGKGGSSNECYTFNLIDIGLTCLLNSMWVEEVDNHL